MRFNTTTTTTTTTTPTRTGHPTAFDRLSARTPSARVRPREKRRRDDRALAQLRHRLVALALAQVQSLRLVEPIRRAAQEAEALAWVEEFPLLVFPCLFQEKLESARFRTQRQMWVEARTSGFTTTTE